MSNQSTKKYLPIAPKAAPARRHLPIAADVRDEDRAWRPIYAVWELTLQCDLACRHCGSRAGRTRPDELDTAGALDMVRQLKELGVLEITLIGGEAYLREDWTTVARAIRDAGIELGIVTGGRGMTPERARAAADAGVQSMSVSIDGLEQTHDTLRGVRGSFRAAMSALENIRAAGMQVAANTQITRPALREIEPLVEKLVEHGVFGWQVSQTVPMGRAADEPYLLLEPFQVIETMAMLHRAQKRLEASGAKLWPGNDIGYFGPYESTLRGFLPRKHSGACGAGRTGIGIEANGDIKGCPSLPTLQYVGGNIRDHQLIDIWERTEPLRFTRNRTVEDLWGYCRDCYYAEDCLAGCSWTSQVFLGRIGNNPFCHHRALELLDRGLRERMVQVQRAPGEPFDQGLFELVLEPWPEDELARAREIARTGEGWLNASIPEPIPARPRREDPTLTLHSHSD